MIDTNYFFILLCFSSLLFNCNTTKPDCRKEINLLISEIDTSIINNLYGFSASSRGFDMQGEKYIYKIMYTDGYRKRYQLPSIQKRRLSDTISLKKIYDYDIFAKKNGKSMSEGKEIAFKYIEAIKELINNHNLIGIHNQLHLGKFMEFILPCGSSIWYKEDEVSLSDPYKKAFEKATLIAPNWYLL